MADTAPKQITPVRVRPSRRSLFPLLSKAASRCSSGDSSFPFTKSPRPRPRSEKIAVMSDGDEPFMGADSGAFGDDVESREEKAKKKTKRSSILGMIKGFASKKSRSFENAIDDENDYERAVGLAESALRSLRRTRFSIGEAGDPWNGSEYHQQLLHLHKMESSVGCMQMDSAAAAGGEMESSEQLLQGGGGAAIPSLAGWLQIEIDTMDDRKRVFNSEVDELRGLLKALEIEEAPISSVNFHILFSIFHHLHSSVEYDEEWARLVVDACRVLHEFSELRRVVVLLLQMTSAMTKDMEPMTEHIRTVLLRETVGQCTQWIKLSEWQRDIICCLLMRRRSTRRYGEYTPSSSSSIYSSSGSEGRERAHTLTRSTLTRKGGMRPGAEEALRDAGIMDAKCREVMETAAKDLGRRLEIESARPMHGHTRPIFFPTIKGI